MDAPTAPEAIDHGRRRIIGAAAMTAAAIEFSGAYEHRLITGGIGHNLPQEAPQEFVHAVTDVDRT